MLSDKDKVSYEALKDALLTFFGTSVIQQTEMLWFPRRKTDDLTLLLADCAEHTKPLVDGAKSVEEVRFRIIRSRFLTFCTKDSSKECGIGCQRAG